MRSDVINKSSGSYGENNKKIITWASGDLSLAAADSGSFVEMDTELGANATATLPTASTSLGVNFKFFYSAAHDANYARIIKTQATGQFFEGCVLHHDSSAANVTNDIQADGDSNFILTINDDVEPGSFVEVVCNGKYWLVSGVITATAAPAFSDS
tara:strand:- start:3584 stop:4051 length:468 start_codon:yes stop_codon:yes gene_type:complete